MDREKRTSPNLSVQFESDFSRVPDRLRRIGVGTLVVGENLEATSARIQAFRNAPVKNIISDNDGTATRTHPNGQENETSVAHLLDRKLPPEALAEASRMRKYYQGRGQLTHEEEQAWMASTLDVYARYELSQEAIQQVATEIPFRKGFSELVASAQKTGGSVDIVSYGLRNPIVESLTYNGIQGVDVFAAQLRVENGIVVGHDPNTVVTPRGKKAMVDAILFKNREKTLIVGDSPSDLPMFRPGAPDQVNVFLLHPGTYAGYGERLDKRLQEIAPHVDVIVKTNGFQEIAHHFGLSG